MVFSAVLFDLDGTLLPMDQDVFVKEYFKGITQKVASAGYDPETLSKTIWAGTKAMVKNSGEESNETVFWKVFADIYGKQALKDIPLFDEYYTDGYLNLKNLFTPNPLAAKTVRMLKEKGCRTVLATNPIFPKFAVDCRVRWAGLEPDDFEYCTSFENSYRCKPNPEYYADILKAIGLKAEQCLMVGNDAREDTVASQLGMKVFLLTDCLINRDSTDISVFPHGGFEELIKYLEENIH